MRNEKKTLVILAFHQSKLPKKKLKKLQGQITCFLMSQNFYDFLIFKQDKKSSYLRFNEKHKKTLTQTKDLLEQNYEDYLYLNCSRSFFCGDYKSFCAQNRGKVSIGLSYENDEDKLEVQNEESKVEGFPFVKEKILYFTKEFLKNPTGLKKELKFIFGRKVYTHSNKTNQTIKTFYEERRPCLFLDRDGIIIKDKGYLSKIDDIEFQTGIFDLVRWANEQKWYVIILTNQSGIGRGLYSEEEYLVCERYIEEKFKEQKLLITKTYFSPYHEDSLDEEIKKKVYTRKPFPGMLLQATKDYPIDLQRSLMLGDKKTDKLIESPLQTFFVKGDYPLAENKRAYSNLEEILKDLQSFSRPIQNNLTSTTTV